MQQGAYISGLAHVALILWALFAGFFLRGGDPLPIETMDVQVLTAAEFEALTTPAAPDLPQPEVAEIPEPVSEPEPDAAPPLPETVTEPEPVPETMPEPLPVAPPPSESAPDQPIEPDAPPTPPAADRVAPEVAPAPPEEAEIAPEETPATAPSETAEVTVEEQTPTAPEEAATEIVTEAETPSTAAPIRSMLPMARPANAVAPAVAEPESTEAKEPEPDNAISNALAEATETAEVPRPAPSGPPLSAGEKDALRVSVQKCWNVGTLSSDALQTTVTVYVAMQPDGTPDVESIRLQSWEGGTEAGAQRAFEAARRAIRRWGLRQCGNGNALPPEKYSQWREIEMIFNPNGMRMK